jgi:hypothetical protein
MYVNSCQVKFVPQVCWQISIKLHSTCFHHECPMHSFNPPNMSRRMWCCETLSWPPRFEPSFHFVGLPFTIVHNVNLDLQTMNHYVHTFSSFLIALCPSPSLRFLGTGVLICLPRIHASHLGGLKTEEVGAPVSVPFLAMSHRDW